MSGRRLLVIAAVTAAVLTTAGGLRLRAEGGDRALDEAGARAVLVDYLDAVEQQDYRTAAAFLAAGSRPSDDRPDLDEVSGGEVSVDEIAAGLADHCRVGCLAPTAIAVEAGSSPYVVVVTFGEPRGHPLQRSFEVGEDDGEPYVRGLPPAGTGTIPQTPR